ncbi:MAG: hypothetical protein DRO11_00380 [Methanobacteriota archaeon]|nr:MAG: hypothetical protein DRO11_00380 [Euryarchaeota archaeon]
MRCSRGLAYVTRKNLRLVTEKGENFSSLRRIQDLLRAYPSGKNAQAIKKRGSQKRYRMLAGWKHLFNPKNLGHNPRCLAEKARPFTTDANLVFHQIW